MLLRSMAMGSISIAQLVSCSPGSVVLSDVPDLVTHVAVVSRDADAELVSASPLIVHRPGGPTTLEVRVPSAGDAVVLGYSGEQIIPITPSDPRRVETESLGAASGCDPTLPPPAFSARITGDLDREAIAEPPRLTAPWLLDACPPEDLASLRMVSSCAALPCMFAGRQERCRLHLALEMCGLEEPVTLGLPLSSSPCLVHEQAERCRAVAAPANAWFSFLCEGARPCEVDAYRVPSTSVLAADRIAVYAVEPYLEPIDPNGDVRGHEILFGYLADLAVLPDRVVTVGHSGAFVRDRECDDARTTELRAYDPETLDLISTSTAPPCLLRITAHPGAAGYFGSYRVASGHRIGRFADTGALLESAEIELTGVSAHDFIPTDLRVSSAGEILAVFQQIDFDQTFLAIVDVSSLVPRVLGPFHLNVWESAVDGDGRIVLANDAGGSANTLAWVDPVSEQLLGKQPFRVSDSPSPVGLSYHPATDRLLASTADEISTFRGLYVTRFGDGSIRATPIEMDLTPTRSSVWPHEPSLAIVAGLRHETKPYGSEAWAMLVDPELSSFLPGAIRVGHGPVSRIRPGSSGVFMLLPWASEIVRVRARE